jgi:hypothetical protein
MMSGGPDPIIPAGMPPGTEYASEERSPEGLLYFRIYAVLFALVNLAIFVFGAGIIASPFFLPKSPGSGADVGLWIGGLFYAGWGLLFLVPTLVGLFAPRRPWGHTMGTVVIALGMFNLVCCIPILIPVLIVWMKPETKAWFGAR